MKLKSLTRIALACAAMAGAASAFAIPEFTINPNALPGVTPGVFNNFVATSVSGTSSELLTYNSALTTGNVTGSGYVDLTSFTNGNVTGPSLSSNVTGLNFTPFLGVVGYGLYATFQLVATQDTTVGFGVAGSNNTLLSLAFQLYYDPAAANTYTPANANTHQNAVVNGTANDVLLATGSYVMGVSGVDSLGGVFLNSTEVFALCSGVGTAKIGATTVPNPACTSGLGTAFFAAPVPFYSLAFDAFNNTSGGVILNGNQLSIGSAAGTIDFVGAVPEPTTLALVGAALAGVGFAQRKRKSAAK